MIIFSLYFYVSHRKKTEFDYLHYSQMKSEWIYFRGTPVHKNKLLYQN